ncbi:hypothetical protein, partial [Agathobaculum sp.]|uniref:hypothetical protein n=1 Tax=Agathobaculum sp. TaxID=2048138 RepID=UPI0027BA6CAE
LSLKHGSFSHTRILRLLFYSFPRNMSQVGTQFFAAFLREMTGNAGNYPVCRSFDCFSGIFLILPPFQKVISATGQRNPTTGGNTNDTGRILSLP